MNKKVGFLNSKEILEVYVQLTEKKYIYLGIIDILQSYNTRKKIAHAIKTLRYGGEEKISTIKPVKYSQRFRSFLVKYID